MKATDDFRYKDIDWEKTDPKEQVFKLIQPKSRVLDLGCWAGRLGWKLKKEKNCFVCGIDINPKAVAIAKKRLDRTLLADFNDNALVKKLKFKDKFDVIVAVDILEHLVNYKNIFSLINKFLEVNGRLIISVPNIAHYKIRLGLFMGNFDYEEVGILDQTHLRFFTQKSIKKLLENEGFKIEKELFTRSNIFPQLLAQQFIFVCSKK